MNRRQSVPQPGQRWVSDSEPELGLGIVMKAEYGRVEIFFPAANRHREYALDGAPLRRIEYKIGETIKTHQQEERVVKSIRGKDGILFYETAEGEVAEAELSDFISFSEAEDRLLGAQVDDTETYQLRVAALQHRNRIRQHPARGFLGARMDLIPHQLHIASEVAGRVHPRVLLADEVGLGKTIEACLILHRLHLTGRAQRTLIVVPESLVHQWFVELYRRFNLTCTIFDEERWEAMTEGEDDSNPFLESQLTLSSLDFLVRDPERANHAVAAEWDLLIVDEAHHLEWKPDASSAEYSLVKDLSEATPSVLLLTATPEQLGDMGHFARLRLLDPQRYTDFEVFQEEREHYGQVAEAVDNLLEGRKLNQQQVDLFAKKSVRLRELMASVDVEDSAMVDAVVSQMLDEFGVGRAMFRNTRKALTGFPERKVIMHPLPQSPDNLDAKVKWLCDLLKQLGNAKVLLICHTKEMAIDVEERLNALVKIKSSVFNEEMTLLQRDRNAAYFADEEGGRILICSEIGSEGRNFQFAHHLVLFDLPDEPDLLEQRIGRLDRIGQTSKIHIHVPYTQSTAEEVLARVYHEALGAFEEILHGSADVYQPLRATIGTLNDKFDAEKLQELIRKARILKDKIAETMQQGQDRLLELASSDSAHAADLIGLIQKEDESPELENFLIAMLDHFGVHVEELGNRGYLLMPGNLTTDKFPVIPDHGMTITFKREVALSREEIGFMSWDHPVVTGALDLLLGSEAGNSSMEIRQGHALEQIVLEAHGIIECYADPELHVERFLPPTPIRVVVDHHLHEHGDISTGACEHPARGDVYELLDSELLEDGRLKEMTRRTRKRIQESQLDLRSESKQIAEDSFTREINRLRDLHQLNSDVRLEEVEVLEKQLMDIHVAIERSNIRLDTLRLIWIKP